MIKIFKGNKNSKLLDKRKDKIIAYIDYIGMIIKNKNKKIKKKKHAILITT